MAKVWKILTLFLAITTLVWLSTLWRWQSAQVNPGAAQLTLHLLLLPLVMTAALSLLMWGVKHLRAYATAPAAVGSSDAATTAAPVASGHLARAQAWRLLSASAQVRAGTAWGQARSAISSGDCRAQLDPIMKDDEGVAIFTAPLCDLDTEPVEAALDVLHTTGPDRLVSEAPAPDPLPEMLRALAALETVVYEVLDAVEPHWPALAPRAHALAHDAYVALPPVAIISVAIPARWPDHAQQSAHAWLQELLAPYVDAALRGAGQSPAMPSAVQPAVQLLVHPVESAEAHWMVVDQQLQQWERDRQPGLLCSLVADSSVGEVSVEALTRSGQLFSGRRQQGRVPGEAAAGLVVVSSMWRLVGDAAPALALLHRASVTRRDKSADVSGRTHTQALQQAVDDTLRGTGIDVLQIQHLTTDADHRTSRTVEVYETLQEKLPHLDPEEQVLRLGVGCGDTGIASWLSCIAITATQVQDSGAAALLLGTSSPFDRLAALMVPVPATTAADTAPATAPERAQAT